MSKKTNCYNCGKEIQSDFISCPYCRADLTHTNPSISTEEIESEAEEYYEEDEDITENSTLSEETSFEEEEYYEEEEYFEENDFIEDSTTEDETDNETIEDNNQEEYFEGDDYNFTEEFNPINITSQESAKVNESQVKPYDANADHYYDDVLPELLDDIRTNKVENILMVVGCILGLFFVMWYLIYFL